MDCFDYSLTIICLIPPDLLTILLSIWISDSKGVCSIALLSFLKVFEKMLYHRIQWTVETRFLLPDFQSGFRNFCSCTANLIILTNRIHSAFLNNASTIAVFLDIAGAFDNVIPNILIQELRNEGFLACFCKFIKSLLAERLIYALRNGDFSDPLIIHKGIP